jgi:hypothetical protein
MERDIWKKVHPRNGQSRRPDASSDHLGDSLVVVVSDLAIVDCPHMVCLWFWLITVTFTSTRKPSDAAKILEAGAHRGEGPEKPLFVVLLSLDVDHFVAAQ